MAKREEMTRWSSSSSSSSSCRSLNVAVVALFLGAVAPVGGLEALGRRAVVRGGGAALVSTTIGSSRSAPAARAATDAEAPMRTSADLTSYAEVTGQARAANLGAGSVSGKSRPVTGCVLVEAPSATGAAVSADLVLRGSVLAKVRFDAPGLKLAKGMYYDVEARNQQADSAYVQVIQATRPLAELTTADLVDPILQTSGRFGAFGAPTDLKFISDKVPASINNCPRLVEVSFAATTPGGSTAPRHALIAATTAPGSPDVILLVASTSETRWTNAGAAATARAAATSLLVDATRPTKLASRRESDFRFEDQGGIRSLTDD